MSWSKGIEIVFIVLVVSSFIATLTSILAFALASWSSNRGYSSISVRQVLQRTKKLIGATFSSWRTLWRLTIARLWRWSASWGSYLKGIRLERASYSYSTGPGISPKGSSGASTSTTGGGSSPTSDQFWADLLDPRTQMPQLALADFLKLAKLFRSEEWTSYSKCLQRYRVKVLSDLERRDDLHTLLRAQGEAKALRYINALPDKVERDLKEIEQEQQREKEKQNEHTRSNNSTGSPRSPTIPRW